MKKELLLVILYCILQKKQGFNCEQFLMNIKNSTAFLCIMTVCKLFMTHCMDRLTFWKNAV